MMHRIFGRFAVSCALSVAALAVLTAAIFGNSLFTVLAQAENRDSAVISGAAAAPGDNIVFPIGSGVINVKSAPYNATGDGTTDDTAALQAALTAARTNLGGRTVYIPNGTYKVSDTLVLTEYDAANTSCAQRTFTLQGQSRDNTIIKLADNTASFGAGLRRAVVNAFRPTTVAPACTPTAPAPQNFTNSAFSLNIQNLTVDTGSGNQGATGINYIANNQGSLRDVLIKTSDAARAGFSGLDLALTRIAGPALIKDLTVEGFDYGIRALEAQYSTVYENITLRNQNRAGIYNQAHVLSIRRLTSENTVPAVQQVGAASTEPGGGGNSVTGFTSGLITLIDSDLSGGASANPAIDIQDGFLFARNITTSGYANAITNRGTAIPSANVTEYRTGDTTYKAFNDSPDASLNLEIRDTPEVAIDDLSNESLRCLPANVPCAPGTFASVKDFGAVQGDASGDDTTQIQAALNSGASTIFFDNNATNEDLSRYGVSRTLIVGGNVRRVMGNSCSIRVSNPLTAGGAVFKFVNSNQSVRLIEGFRHHVSMGVHHFVEQASAQTLVMRNMLIRRAFAYRNTDFGDVYIEDFHNLLNGTDNRGASFIFKNQRVWARQINPEVGLPEIINDGATVWILGLKSEQQSTLVRTINGGKTEVLGGLNLNSRTGQTSVSVFPAFENIDSSMSVVHTEYRQNPTRGFFPVVVRETRGATVETLTYDELPNRPAAFPSPTPATTPTPYTTTAYVVPLYNGFVLPTTAPIAPTNLVARAFSANQVILTFADNSNNENVFEVERSVDNGATFTLIGTTGQNAVSFTDSGLTQPLSSYIYRVRAVNSIGASAYSNQTIAAAPAAPLNLIVAAVSGNSITLNFTDAANENGYRVERSTDAVNFAQIATLGENATTYTDTNLTAGTRYFYRVRAFNAAGNSAASNLASASVAGNLQTVAPNADAYVEDCTGVTGACALATTNFGANISLFTRASAATSNTPVVTTTNRLTYLRFDTTAAIVADNARVRLRLRKIESEARSITIDVFSVDSTWTETGTGSITFNNRPAIPATPIASAANTTNFVEFIEFDVTDYVRAERAAGRNVVSFALRNQTGTEFATRFDSKEAIAAGSIAPQLAVSTFTETSDLSLTQTDSAEPAIAGDALAYQITVTNNGGTTATGVRAVSVLPANVTFNQPGALVNSSLNTSAGCQFNAENNAVSCALQDLAQGASQTVQISITPLAAGTIANTATAFANGADSTAANDATSESTVVNALTNVAPNSSQTVSTAPTVAGRPGITATLTNDADASSANIALATYNFNPTSTINGLTNPNGFVDLKVTNPTIGDSATAQFYYPSSVTAPGVENRLRLYYFIGSGWAEVKSSGNQFSTKTTVDNLDGTVSGGRFTTVFDQTSTPRATELGGQIFAFGTGAPTAAAVSVGGRVTANNRGLARARVTLTDQNGAMVSTATNSFGNYRFTNVASGAVYIVEVQDKRFAFEPQIVTVGQQIDDLNFATLPRAFERDAPPSKTDETSLMLRK